MYSQVDRWIEEHREELIQALRQSLAIPSVEGPALPGAPFGAEVKRALEHALGLAGGFGFETMDLEGYIGCVDFGSGAETLGIMAHLDVVPVGEGWERPPFGAEMDEKNIYGRGAIDDKGPAFASLFAMRAIKECGVPLRRRVRLMLGCDEESGWGCMEHYKKCQPLPELAFSPDAEYPLVNSEKGIFHGHYRRAFASAIRVSAGERANVVPGSAVAWVPLPMNRVLPIAGAYLEKSGFAASMQAEGEGTQIAVQGHSAHASMPEQGQNALAALLCLLAKLPLEGEDAKVASVLAGCFGMDYHGQGVGLDEQDESGRLTLNLGVMRWDEQGVGELALDIRHPISLPAEEVQRRLGQALEKAGLELFSTHLQPGHFVPEGSELVAKLLEVYRRRSGDAGAQPLKIGGGTYARAMQNAVAFGCQRPGINNALHMPNEFIGIEQLVDDAKMIAAAILALAG